MFLHTVLFEIKPKEVQDYCEDSKMWATFAKKAKGFLAYFTFKRLGVKNQYVSLYEWKTKADHDRFMKKYHKWLESKSTAKVKVLDYYQFVDIDEIR